MKLYRGPYRGSLRRLGMLLTTLIIAVLAVPLLAGSHEGDASLIHACVQKSADKVRIVGANEECRSSETSVHWLITGPQGPVGPQGSPGPQGPPGPPSDTSPLAVTVDCSAGQTLTNALSQEPLRPLNVALRGLCNENITITRNDVTLYGDAPGSGISGVDPTRDVILIDVARRVVIENLTVTGGKNGIVGARGSSFAVRNSTIQNSIGTLTSVSDGTGVKAQQNSQVVIHGNVIENHPINGIWLEGSDATITANTIRQIGDTGISMGNGASARIGLTDDEAAAGNIIQSSTVDGISMFDSSSALLYGNTIEQNRGAGISAIRNSSLRMLGLNTIRSNGVGISLIDSHLRTGRGSFRITPNQEVISQNTSTGIFADANSVLDLREGLTIANNAPGFGILLQHGSRARMRGTTVSNNNSGGILLQFGSSVQFLFPPNPQNTITGNGGFGLNCVDPESSFIGGFTGGGNALGDVNLGVPGCTGF